MATSSFRLLALMMLFPLLMVLTVAVAVVGCNAPLSSVGTAPAPPAKQLAP